ncbi:MULTISPECIES: DUF2061 domain-containing protein [unclassified Oceanobacter]|uniref:DUF2061 domain-containing protein n=1 Tax=unclassified Oceanobacter TaxID=2620260 RepID=UPI0027357EE2|nr:MULTISPECIES: DUF2061 domain-containing protein [unclassified Oceanobacter]MDP2610448.1 DUF2061 domain-containing protein [Oceanobacter sp. 1_MG-2023]MDP2613685.1 DUF2061 domain-containing protein [Oceanobacter sp. 2_MG-2023]
MTKTLTFAVMHFSVAFTVAYALTGDLLVGGLVAVVEPAINTVAFYFHELAWNMKTNVTDQIQAAGSAGMEGWVAVQAEGAGR